MYVNDSMILELAALSKAQEIRHIVISPGARYCPIVRSVEADLGFLYSVMAEGSAGFFVTRDIRAVNAVAAVLITSKTASVKLTSAMRDAFYRQLPLLALAADRLAQLLNQMEEQMIDQMVLFEGTLHARALLSPTCGDIDYWYENRVINESLLQGVEAESWRLDPDGMEEEFLVDGGGRLNCMVNHRGGVHD